MDELRPQGCLKAEGGGWTSFVLKAASRLRGRVDELRPQGCLKAEGEGGRASSSRLPQG